jgi:hypothetical protein
MSSDGEKLVVKNVVRLRVSGGLSPSAFNHIQETRHLLPKLLKSKGSRPLWTPATSKEEPTMVRERGGEHMQDVAVMTRVPLIIAKDGVDLA